MSLEATSALADWHLQLPSGSMLGAEKLADGFLERHPFCCRRENMEVADEEVGFGGFNAEPY